MLGDGHVKMNSVRFLAKEIHRKKLQIPIVCIKLWEGVTPVYHGNRKRNK